jgi:hypothetical protein
MLESTTEHARIAPGECGNDSSAGIVRDLFLIRVRTDVPAVLGSLWALHQRRRELYSVNRADVSAWAASWSLQDSWIVDTAVRTLNDWAALPNLSKARQWASSVDRGELLLEPPLPSITWLPTIQTEREFRDRVEQYIRGVRHWAADQTLIPTTVKANLARDLHALVEFQVKGDDLTMIARSHFGATECEDEARRALSSLARFIGLTLRE